MAPPTKIQTIIMTRGGDEANSQNDVTRGMVEIPLACHKMAGTHEAEVIAAELLRVMTDYGITEKVVVMASDSAQNMI